MSPAPLVFVCDHRGEGLSEALQGLAAAGFRIDVSTRIRTTREKLAVVHPTVIVLDPLAEGGRAELEEIERLRGDEEPVPVLLVADASDALPAVLAARTLERGVLDLIHRGSPLEEYALRIERLCALAAHRGEIAELRHRALHDDRTDLLRPKAFQQRLAEHFSAAERHQLDLALVVVDLDDFGRVNKAFDHTVGDLLIAKVGEVIRSALRAEDVAGRIGGDEFAVLLPYTRPIEAAHVVRRLRDEIRRLSGRLTGTTADIEISASLGFETFDGSDLDTVETFRLHAEIALREAKRLGGHRGTYYRSLEARGSK